MNVTYSNFRLIGMDGGFAHAEVDETTKLMFREPVTVRRTVHRAPDTTYWRFTETGEFTPGFDVDNLWKAWVARKSLERASA